MGEKSEQKRKLILECAKKVFMEKGYKDVTMKDIVDACGISRGGLYLYYGSTKEIFLDILEGEIQKNDDTSSENMPKRMTATDILMLFLKEQKKELLRKKNSLILATYEFFFANKIPKKENPLKKQFDEAVFVLQNLIESGVENGEFYCENAKDTARNIMYVLEGLKITAKTMGISEESVDKELLYIIQGLILEE